MEHIRQFDWCSSEPDIYFLNEQDLDNCVTERILRNKFRDPLLSSESEDEALVKPKINWSEVLKRKENDDKHRRMHVPGLRMLPPYPKVSALTPHQHYQCLKVLCADNPNVLPAEFIPRPTKQDHRVFEELKLTYAKEQQEYIEWTKTLWTNGQCVRALRPKPAIEMVYEAEYKMRAKKMESYPKHYKFAVQIPLEARSDKCEMIYKKDLTSVNLTTLPRVECPDQITQKFTILRPCSVPEPCDKHPCRFVLPTEKQMSIMPLTEVHRELAQFALDSGTQCVASEAALRCLVELDRAWHLPLSVCSVITADGDKKNVLVLGSEFSTQKESAQTRTYRAFRHLLVSAMIPSSEKARVLQMYSNEEENANNESAQNISLNDRVQMNSNVKENAKYESGQSVNDAEMYSDEENDSLVIDAGEDKDEDEISMDTGEPESKTTEQPEQNKRTPKETVVDKLEQSDNNQKNDGFYSCTCKDSLFEHPPARSFKKWQVRNSSSTVKHDLIVHCSHKVRGESGEVILEPIPEYQIDLGGSKQSDDKIKSIALSLYLRRNASLINVRADSGTGDVVTIDNIFLEDYLKTHGNVVQEVVDRIHAAISQLQGFLPGNYILQHEPSHGSNALLYVSCAAGASAGAGASMTLSLGADGPQLARSDDAAGVKTPPALAPVLLPCHKFRKILPCAFTPFENQLAKESKKPVTRQRTPPQAIKWPRRKQKIKSTNQ